MPCHKPAEVVYNSHKIAENDRTGLGAPVPAAPARPAGAFPASGTDKKLLRLPPEEQGRGGEKIKR